MKILGKEYGLLLTVGATEEIAALCPEGDLTRIREALQRGKSTEITEFFASMAAAMSRGYEARKAFMEPGYEPRPLTPEILRLLTPEEMAAMQAETLEAFTAGKKTSVEAAEAKKNEASAAPGSGST